MGPPRSGAARSTTVGRQDDRPGRNQDKPGAARVGLLVETKPAHTDDKPTRGSVTAQGGNAGRALDGQ